MSTLTIDDRNPAVAYSGEWYLFGSQQEYMGTTKLSYARGSMAVLEFEGIGVSVRGTIPPAADSGNTPSTSSYSIDGGPLTFYTTKLSEPHIYSIIFYHSPPLENAKHKLTITNEKTGGYLYLDYFEVIQSPPTTPSPPPPSATSDVNALSSISHSGESAFPITSRPLSVTSSSFTFPVYSDSNTSSSSATPTDPSSSVPASGISSSIIDSQKHGLSVGALVGCIAGSAVLLILVLLMFWRLCGRRKQLNDNRARDGTEANGNPSALSPFIIEENHYTGSPQMDDKRNRAASPLPPPYSK